MKFILLLCRLNVPGTWDIAVNKQTKNIFNFMELLTVKKKKKKKKTVFKWSHFAKPTSLNQYLIPILIAVSASPRNVILMSQGGISCSELVR